MGSAKKQSDLWGRKARDWSEFQEIQHKPLWNEMLSMGGVSRGSIILDVGCGAGGASLVASKHGAIVKGIDATPELIELARNRVPNAEFVVGDIEDLPYTDSEFDVVIAANIIQYSENRASAMNELKRVCKPGGKIVAGLFGSPEKVKFAAIFGAIREAMPTPPSGGGPFELSLEGALEDVFKEVDLVIDQEGEVDCTFEYENWDTFWRATASGGPLQAIINVIGEKTLIKALKNASSDFTDSEGRIVIGPNSFRYVGCTVHKHM